MADESFEQKKKNILESYERESTYFQKSFEENANLLAKFQAENNLPGVERAKQNMAEANQILGDLMKNRDGALEELISAEKLAQATENSGLEQAVKGSALEDLSQSNNQTSNDELDKKHEESEDEDYYYGASM
jgi:tRNA nucleotidyltransferase/poly(A) polymerase